MPRVGRADDQSVRCRLCGERYRLITPTHLRSRHRWTGDNPGLAYKARFDVPSVWSAASRRAMSASLTASHDRRGRRWTRERVLAALRRLRAARFRDAAPRLYWSAQRLFGSWASACRVAGRRSEWPQWTRARVLKEIRGRRELRWSRVPAPLYWAGQRLFGSWKAALERAGRRRPGPRWTQESVLLALRRRTGPLSSSAVRADDPALYKAVYRLFRRWGDATSRV